MSADNHANYAKIGFTLVAGVVAMIGTLVYLGGVGDHKREFLAETYCESGVSGLSVGSEVNFRGVKVGEVRDITFVRRVYEDANPTDAQKILIVMAFPGPDGRGHRKHATEEELRRHVEHGLRATIASSGITGLSHVELNYPRTRMKKDEISWNPSRVCVPPAPSILESFSDSVSHVMNQLNRMDFTGAWSNVVSISESVSRIAGDASEIMDTQKHAVGEILGDFGAAAADLRALAAELKDNPSLLLRGRDPAPLPETAK
jgi:ABC-type transporter Mla subunit MlaD